MQFDQMLDQREAQAQAAETSRGRRVALFEPVKNIWQQLGLNPPAGVTHDDQHVRAGAPQPYPHMPAFGGELDGVRYKIPDDLLQSGGVAGKLSGFRIKVRGDDD